jgi:hypothetical protein
MTPTLASSRVPAARRGHNESLCWDTLATSFLVTHGLNAVSINSERVTARDSKLARDTAPRLFYVQRIFFHFMIGSSPKHLPEFFRQTPSIGQPTIGKPAPFPRVLPLKFDLVIGPHPP